MSLPISRCTLCVLVVGLLAGCGWQLRGYDPGTGRITQAGASLDALQVISENRSNAFFRVFNNTLVSQKIELDYRAPLRLYFAAESLRRQPLSYNRSGVPAQFQITLTIRYYVSREQDVLIEEREIVSRRNYDFDPNLVIAKDREEELLLAEMRRELSERILTSIRRSL